MINLTAIGAKIGCVWQGELVARWSVCRIVALMLVLMVGVGVQSADAQALKRGNMQLVAGGVMLADSVAIARADSIAMLDADSLAAVQKLIDKQAKQRQDSLARVARRKERARQAGRLDAYGNIIPREPWFSDSMSLSKVCLTSMVLPGYGQIYNKQYWKLPILYGTLGGSIGLAIHQGSKYKPLKREYDAMLLEGMSRTEEMNLLQRRMVRTNTTRQLLWGAAAVSYIYFLGDAAIKYSTNEVSDVKKATTLSLICPGAGQVYNESYWKVPIVVGGMASMVYVFDWNNRGFKRFKTAHALRADFDEHPENYPDGVSKDEFRGRYSTTFLKNLRDSYRRNRDLSIILTAAVYAFQAVDAHVDAHLKDFDVSDDLTVKLEPMFDYQYSYVAGGNPIFGVNLNLTF